MSKNIFGTNLKVLRKQKGLTQLELSEIFNVSIMTIRRFEAGTRIPKFDMIEKIAKFFEVEPSALLNWDRPIDDMDKGVLEIYPNFNPKYGYISDMVNGEYPTKVKKANLQKDTVSKLGTLNALGQQKANEYITDLSEQEKYTKPDEE